MYIECVPVGGLQTNCYILSAGRDARRVVLVDPGAEAEKIKAALGEREPEAVLLTHGHYDHTGALYAFKDLPIYISEHDAPMLHDSRLSAGQLGDDHADRPSATNFYKEGDVVRHAGLELTVMETPGHTRGGVCLVCGNQILTGDTLFKGDYGRTDLPGGSAMMMRQSLRRLFQLHGYTAYPGHGEETTIK